jgi:hypothetical protein
MKVNCKVGMKVFDLFVVALMATENFDPSFRVYVF